MPTYTYVPITLCGVGRVGKVVGTTAVESALKGVGLVTVFTAVVFVVIEAACALVVGSA